MIEGKTVRNAGPFTPRPEGFLVWSDAFGDDNGLILDVMETRGA
jgi:hypothetical protein